MKKTADKLQKYACSKAGEENTIWSKTTNSAYYNFNGTSLRISDHLPTTGAVNSSGTTMSIISTSNKDQYILLQYSTGRLRVISYNQAKEIVRSISMVSDVFRYPGTPFRLEKELLATLETGTILGVPVKAFSENQLTTIKAIVNKVRVQHSRDVAAGLKEEKKTAKFKVEN